MIQGSRKKEGSLVKVKVDGAYINVDAFDRVLHEGRRRESWLFGNVFEKLIVALVPLDAEQFVSFHVEITAESNKTAQGAVRRDCDVL